MENLNIEAYKKAKNKQKFLNDMEETIQGLIDLNDEAYEGLIKELIGTFENLQTFKLLGIFEN